MKGTLHPHSPEMLWYSAYANPPGIRVRVRDRGEGLEWLYRARRELQDPDLAHLEIRTDPRDLNVLWIVNPGVPE
jgi:hypothetical protein